MPGVTIFNCYLVPVAKKLAGLHIDWQGSKSIYRLCMLIVESYQSVIRINNLLHCLLIHIWDSFELTIGHPGSPSSAKRQPLTLALWPSSQEAEQGDQGLHEAHLGHGSPPHGWASWRPRMGQAWVPTRAPLHWRVRTCFYVIKPKGPVFESCYLPYFFNCVHAK